VYEKNWGAVTLFHIMEAGITNINFGILHSWSVRLVQ
jgi:hypothetical protein